MDLWSRLLEQSAADAAVPTSRIAPGPTAAAPSTDHQDDHESEDEGTDTGSPVAPASFAASPLSLLQTPMAVSLPLLLPPDRNTWDITCSKNPQISQNTVQQLTVPNRHHPPPLPPSANSSTEANNPETISSSLVSRPTYGRQPLPFLLENSASKFKPASGSMSRSTRPPSLDSDMLASGRRKRLSLLPLPKPLSTASEIARTPTHRTTFLHQRDGPSTRLAPTRRAASETTETQEIQSVPSAIVEHAQTEARNHEGLASGICNVILENYGVDADNSSRTLLVRDAVTRCLDEISNLMEGTSPTYFSSLHSPASVVSSLSAGGGLSGRLSRQSAGRRSIYSKRRAQFLGLPDDDNLGLDAWDDGSVSNSLHRAGRDSPVSDTRADNQLQYPCPFRRRNPVRFNIRDRPDCARAPFYSLTQLKYHITSQHALQKSAHQCRRCRMGFETEAALDDHMMQPRERMCETNSVDKNRDPEDGITDDVSKKLTAGGTELFAWDGLWHLLFPTDEETATSDFHPVIELVEVEHEFDKGEEALKASLQDMLRLLLANTIDEHFRSFLAGQFELVYETHRANIMRQCLNRGSSAAATDQPKPIAKASNQQVILGRQQNRRSRQSVLFQTLRSPDTYDTTPNTPGDIVSSPLTHDRDNNLGIHNDDSRPQLNGRSLGSAINGTSRLPLSPLSPTLQYAVRNKTRSPSLAGARSPRLYATRSPRGEEIEYPGPRDSRDSGISIACHLCEVDVCRCDNVAGVPLGGNGDTSLLAEPVFGTRDHQSELTNPETKQQALADTVAQHRLRHQPNLRVTTRTLEALVSPTSGEPFHSPQSFKERVLRKHDTPSQGSVAGKRNVSA
ncbi:hypothetical protein B0T17DRAFT_597698 [Bombardia bombarda]|uniref:C2H2-type domain-containing protein n=1 Tax=Bombardia bombarda TaxID=252184 RepID=A0AA39X8H9_9PEZI|nr:hypothetical protein B0T17DRAFT_597698 [Bombardia bombarda]